MSLVGVIDRHGLLPGEEMGSSFGPLGQSLREVITRSDFEVKEPGFSALVLDAKIRDRNAVVHI